MRKSFIVHIDSLGVLDDLNTEQCGELFKAIAAHQLGESIDLSPIVKIAFNPFKNQFDRDDIKYEKTCIARAEAGSKGGKQKVANASKSKQSVSNVADSVSKSKSKNDSKSDSDSKTLDQSAIDRDNFFEMFWLSGIRKVNKKKSKSLFNSLLKKTDASLFTDMLITDVKVRLNSNQLGFAEMHPTTYLNGERWNDEVIPNAENRLNGSSGSNRLSAVDRVRAKSEENRAARANNRQDLENTGGGIREHDSSGFRGRDAGGMDSVIEGDYSQSDS